MNMDMQIEDSTQALDKRHRPWLNLLPLEATSPQQPLRVFRSAAAALRESEGSLTATQKSSEGIGSQAVGAAREAPADARAGQQLGGAGNAGRSSARVGVTRRTPTHAETAAAYPGAAVSTGSAWPRARGAAAAQGGEGTGGSRGRQKVLWNAICLGPELSLRTF